MVDPIRRKPYRSSGYNTSAPPEIPQDTSETMAGSRYLVAVAHLAIPLQELGSPGSPFSVWDNYEPEALTATRPAPDLFADGR